MSLYESTIEPTQPLPDYDPAMDAPETPAMRRKPPFETIKNERGRAYRFEAFTVLTGYCKGYWGGKYASIFIVSPQWQPLIMCDRNDIARLLRFSRKGSVC